MARKIIIDHKEYEMPKMSVDTYMDYLDLSEQVDGKTRYTRTDIEAMTLFICKAYDNQFSEEDLKNPETGLDAAGIIPEFQFIDVEIGMELEKRMKKIQENFTDGK